MEVYIISYVIPDRAAGSFHQCRVPYKPTHESLTIKKRVRYLANHQWLHLGRSGPGCSPHTIFFLLLKLYEEILQLIWMNIHVHIAYVLERPVGSFRNRSRMETSLAVYHPCNK